MMCRFCQNFEISQLREGDQASAEAIAAMMLDLQQRGCHNINLVSPTHVLLPILEALRIAAHKGLRLPLVWNSGGFDSLDLLTILDGIVDIYMPDAKYGSDEAGEKYSGVPRYWETSRAALREMHRQVGDLVVREGIAQRGLLVRHLVLPNEVAGTAQVVAFLKELSPHTYMNVMGQYHPEYRAAELPEIARRVKREEVDAAKQLAEKAGLRQDSPRQKRKEGVDW